MEANGNQLFTCRSRGVHADSDVILRFLLEGELVFRVLALLLDHGQRVDFALLQNRSTDFLVAFEVDDGLQLRHVLDHATQLRQQDVAGDDVGDLGLVDTVLDRIQAQGVVQGGDVRTDAEDGVRAKQPLSTRFGEDHDHVAWLDAVQVETSGQVLDSLVDLVVGHPLVVAQDQLAELLAIRLQFVLFVEHLANAQTLAITVTLNAVLEQFGKRVALEPG